ncbi:unnamed protein product, partial [Hapterophycus canaliculatus]
GCPLGVHHIFCLFDGHGGDSVSEYCRVRLTDRIVERVQSVHNTRSAVAAGTVPSKGPEEGSVHRGDPDAGTGFDRRVPGGSGATADAEVSLVTDCVREACREVDFEVKGKFFTPTGRYVAPRVADLLDVTPPPRQIMTPLSEEKEDDVSQARATTMEEEGPEKAARVPNPRMVGAGEEAERDEANSNTETMNGSSSRSSSGGTTSGVSDTAEGGDREGAFSTCGTTSLIVIVSDKYVICCNTGDSRRAAVLASEGASIPLSTDHKPENQAERRRIEAAGGRVKHNRVEGKLAVSRCIGDHPFKSDPSLPLERQMVVCDPEVTAISRSDAGVCVCA